MKGKNDPTTFLPLNTKIGTPAKSIKDKENICLSMEQAGYIYEKVMQESIVNMNTIKQEIEEDKLSENNIDEDEDMCIVSEMSNAHVCMLPKYLGA